LARRRLDAELVRRGLAASREEARNLVEGGVVRVAGAPASKPDRLVAEHEPVLVSGAGRPFVSRGGEKLEAALARFRVDVAGKRCLDAGASTGGFTDCLLQRGAATVLAVDVGYGQLHPKLRHDPRVVVAERTNVRLLRAADLAGTFEVVAADLSFISLRAVVPNLAGDLACPGADLVLLVKPQFEAGRQHAARGRGVIRQPAVRRGALADVASALVETGATIMGAMASPLLGPAGNAEYFVHARAHEAGGWVDGGPALDAILDAAIAETPS
jgi:23S rRNA (cytidine1920-2'-O)/16S rRNA (cytidine1409-2'-O)-methyltransferase